MSDLTYDEKRAVQEVATSMMDDIQGFDFANASLDDIVDFLGYSYTEICAGVAKQYGDDIPF